MDGDALLLLTCLLLTGGVCGQHDAVFLYSRLGEDILLPCITLVSTDCSLVSWTFYRGGGEQYTQLATGGRVEAGSEKAGRLSVTSNCSVGLRRLRASDAGSYVCLRGAEAAEAVAGVYLSVLSVTSPSAVTELRPGGNLSLGCVLFTYYDAGSCTYSTLLRLSWTDGDGAALPADGRYQLTRLSRCHVTLRTDLRSDDNNRRWRCQVTNEDDVRVVFLDFTSTFLFGGPPGGQSGPPPAAAACPVQLPVSRLLLCAALPIMVVIVGTLTWRRDRTKTPASELELQEAS